MIEDELAGMAVFAAVAEAKSLREAGERLGVSGSAVSQALRQLEGRLGVALVQRTTRSLHLTAAGERLHSTVRVALTDIRVAAAAVRELGANPRGTIRLLVAPAAERFLSGEVVAGFLAEFPEIRLDLHLTYEPVDIVAKGYDAGVRPGDVVDLDMIGVSLSEEIRVSVVGSLSYFARHPKPKHPRELVDHPCINWHPTAESPPFRWEFRENGRDFSVNVVSRILSNDPELNLRLARAGLGLTLTEATDAALGEGMVKVLENFTKPYPGFYLYYPQRRHVSPALRALIDYLRRQKRK